jgi:DNA repair protein RecN (Recombination protein N)
MLERLTIKNYALIEGLDLEFSGGLNVFTGETGAGKSIIIEALGLALGARVSAEVVRKGAAKATVDAVFSDVHAAGLIEEGNNELILTREVDGSGKSRAFFNGRPVAAGVLADAGRVLVDIHGQYEHQTLLSAQNQLRIVDAYGGLSELREEAARGYAEVKNTAQELEAARLSGDERRRLEELYAFQVKEIEDAALKPGEDEELDKKLPQVKNAEKLARLTAETRSLLSSGDGSGEGAIEFLGRAQKELAEIERLSSGGFARSGEIESVLGALKDLKNDLSSWGESLQADPQELERLIARKDLILKLKKKYGGDVAGILAYKEKSKTELEKLRHGEESIAVLEKKFAAARSRLENACAGLSAKRKNVVLKLQKSAEKELKELGMPKARFEICIEGAEPGPAGADKAEFVFSPNVGEDLKPLKEIASGGEMSRTMLALKTALGESSDVPIMVFDEIDSGVSGPMGSVVGRKLAELSRRRQVFCITHLPQIASFADSHFKVEKFERVSRTYVSVQSLGEEARAEEVARMLSGGKVTPSARAHAADLLKSAKK